MTSRAVLDPVIRKLNLNVEVKGASYDAVVVKTLEVPASWEEEQMTLESKGGDVLL